MIVVGANSSFQVHEIPRDLDMVGHDAMNLFIPTWVEVIFFPNKDQSFEMGSGADLWLPFGVVVDKTRDVNLSKQKEGKEEEKKESHWRALLRIK